MRIVALLFKITQNRSLTVEPTHNHTAASVMRADVLTTTGNRESIEFILRHAEQIAQCTDAAEVRTGFVNAASAPPTVVVNAPSILSNH